MLPTPFGELADESESPSHHHPGDSEQGDENIPTLCAGQLETSKGFRGLPKLSGIKSSFGKIPFRYNKRKYAHETQQLRGYARLIVFSSWFSYYYVLMICINVFAIVYSFYKYDEAPHIVWFLLLEVFITVALLVEVMIRAFAEGFWNFCSNRSNVFDAVLAVMCVGALFAFVYMPAISETLEEDLALLIRVIRDIVRLLRLVFVVKNGRRSNYSVSTIQPISLIEISRHHDEHEAYEHDTLLSSMMAEGNNRRLSLSSELDGTDKKQVRRL
ncbi:hypothetical protein GUITHDRAFT_103101 [Guillardia theta CCMP2712]|uniref:Ion transport domain-containing protein n=1 Tax=Guillardia theta (strain CCMP2712) TaxID=905079 RepID=L1JSL8_GUITC|nr:hypothetical protein GUITHDRAFT_103101 [Guillardia theta CCMP2712]EKX51185.1 hypothetical protein GUITHDRAFT_103101 [Guillardia theta CCMP2712]|eukprot:XP_005838165.1 hypothetical protein GUITHDRAFT_103101 [Guillardia theta CCMP2712]